MNTAIDIESVADLEESGTSLLVAFASQEGDIVDQHFGSARSFFLYGITADSANLLANKAFGYEKKDGNEDKLKPKLKWLVGADVVYCGSIGGSATRQLVSLGINPIQVKGGPDVEELIEELQEQLRGKPEFWLANILKKKARIDDDERFDAMDDSGWED